MNLTIIFSDNEQDEVFAGKLEVPDDDNPQGNPTFHHTALSPTRGRSQGVLDLRIYRHHHRSGGRPWYEWMLVNGSEEAPAGLVRGDLVIFDGKKALLSQGGLTLHDGCGYSGMPGLREEPVIVQQHPWLPDVTVEHLSSTVFETRGGSWDYTWNTHQVGSPRNKLLSPCYAAMLCKEPGTLDNIRRRLAFWTMEQIGCHESQGPTNIPGRPYHFYHSRDGSPLNPPRDVTFGEHGITIDKWHPERNLGRDQINATPSPKTAWDYEHLEVEELFAAWDILGLKFAKEDLLLIAHMTCNRFDQNTRGIWHSSRTLGWWLRTMARAYQISWNDYFLTAARLAVNNWIDGRFAPYTGKQDDIYIMPKHAVLTRENDKFFWNLMGEHPAEACWQAAVAGSAAFLWAELDPPHRPAWLKLAMRAADIIQTAWNGSGGLYENICAIHGEQLSSQPSLYGTSSWCLDTWARAYQLDHNKYKAVNVAWESVKDRKAGGEYAWHPGGRLWNDWCHYVEQALTSRTINTTEG